MRIVYTFTAIMTLSACASTQTVTKELEPIDPQLWTMQDAAVEQMMKNFERVHFEFDSAVLSPASRDALADNVEIMRVFENLGVEIEGHCDERGTGEYNLALGQRRAEAIHKYMTTAGIQSGRLTTISYGEEQPIAFDDSEQAHAENRRAEFRIIIGAGPKVHGTVDDFLALGLTVDPSSRPFDRAGSRTLPVLD